MPSKWSSVDLPAPEGPITETNSPSLIATLMRRSTNVLVGQFSKYFSTLRSTIIGELIRYPLSPNSGTVHSTPLLVAQGHQRIHRGRALRRNIGGRERNQNQQCRYGRECRRVRRF